MRRVVLVVFLLLISAPAAYAWTWPVQGPVLVAYAFDHDHPYAGGQHRGIDIGADAGATVAAPASGTVTFAGIVPTSGQSVTIATGDGYSVTLTHLGSVGVTKGASVGEGDSVGTVGPSGTPEIDVPYVYMGVRVSSDAQGYVDPLSFLPALVQPPPAPSSAAPVAAPSPATTASVPSTTTTSATTPLPSTATTQSPSPAPIASTVEQHVASAAPATVPAAPAQVPAAVFAEPAVAEPGFAETGGATLVVRPSPPREVPVAETPGPRLVRPVVSHLLAPPTADKAAVHAGARASAPRSRPPVVPAPRPRHRTPPVVRAVRSAGAGFPVGLFVLGAILAATFAGMGVRMISSSSKSPEGALPDAVAEDPGRGRMAVCERSAAPGPCRRPRGAVGHLRPLSPAQGQRRAHGERDRRARNAGDGVRRPRRRVPS